MPIINLIIENAVGLHARPAALFVQAAQVFESEIEIKVGERQANGKSLLEILALGVKKGTEISIDAHGPDSNIALKSLQKLITSNFGEIS